MKIELVVNGQAVSAEVEPRTLLVDLLREHLRLTGTHVGCDTSQCGACTVHIDGRTAKSCTVLAAQAHGAVVVTIEGIGAPGHLHPMQAAFHDNHAQQCGYCTPGMIMSAIELAEQLGPDAAEKDIRDGLGGNICRCTGYHNIVKAVRIGAAAMRAAKA